MQKWKEIAQHISQITNERFEVNTQQAIAGGDINTAYLIGSNTARYFIKINQPTKNKLAMFEAEQKSLQALAQAAKKSSNKLIIPKPLCAGINKKQSYLVMQYLPLQREYNPKIFGEQLALLHRVTHNNFGWEIDNTIGSTLQLNQPNNNWLTFWAKHRLGFQLKLARSNGYHGELQRLGEKLLIEMPKLFGTRQVKPSILHGDLWAGNVAGLNSGEPVIFDPALYYGDRETDIAMTYLFGGFSKEFYDAYQNNYKLDDGFKVRKTFYNIYHVLNHLNIFGSGYKKQALQMMKKVLAEIN